MRWMDRRRLLVLIAALTTCATSFGGASEWMVLPSAEAGGIMVEPIEPPAAWARAYHRVERCVGRSGDFEAVHWFVTPHPWRTKSGDLWVGAFTPPQTIVLVAGDTMNVRHESLHHILWASGWRPAPADSGQIGVHPSPPFGLCAPLYGRRG